MKHHTHRVKISSPGFARAQKIRGLIKCIAELKALQLEALSILRDLMIAPAAALFRELCTRFRVLHKHFSIRFHEAKALAIYVIGSFKTRRVSA
jgi:hypothetical protein